MLQLIERRDGAPRIRRPRLHKVPPRRVAWPLAVGAGLLVLTVAGMVAGLRIAGRTTHNTALGTVSFSVSPSIHGRVDAFVPIADWGARAHAFRAPLTVHVEPRAVNRRTVTSAAGGNGTVLAEAERDARGAARASLLRAYRWAIGGALVLGLVLAAVLAWRPSVPRGHLIALAATPPLCAILIGGATLLRVKSTFDSGAFDHPHFYARGAELEQLLKVADNAQRVGAGYTSQVQRALGGFAALVAAGGRFSGTAPPTQQVVLASDLHDNLPALTAVRREFGQEPIFFPGDFGQNGSASETDLLVRKFKKLGRPIVAVSGNHDSSLLMRRMAGIGVTVLTSKGRLLPSGRTDGKPVQKVLGLKVAGYQDPLESHSSDPASPNRIFSFAERPHGDLDFAVAVQQVADWFDNLPQRPDVVMVHENGIAQNLARSLHEGSYRWPLVILTGHDHKQHIDKYGPIVVVDGGSVGAGGPFGISKTSVGFAYLNLSAPASLESVDLVQTEPFTGAAQADRVVLSSEQPCVEQRLTCH
jgi:predicted phosphodiesterase